MTTRRSLTALAIAAATMLAPITPAAAGGRPATPPAPVNSVAWTPPTPTVNGALATLDEDVLGYNFASSSYTSMGEGVFLPVVGSAPIEVAVEREIVNAFGEGAIRAALEQFNGIRSTRFHITMGPITTTGVHGPAADGVNRVFFDDETCSGNDLAWSHVSRVDYDYAYGTGQVAVNELDIGICRRMRASALSSSLAHELMHTAGMAHLCNQGESCWKAGMDADNSCRLMYPAFATCQKVGELDIRALSYLYPAAPRLAGPGRAQTAARVSYEAAPTNGATTEIVFVDGGRDTDLAIQAAAFAAVRKAPLLLVDTNRRCSEGAWGEELNRIATSNAKVWAVGPLHVDCAADLTGWGLQVEQVSDARALANEIAGPPPADAASSATSEPSSSGGLLGLGGSRDEPAPAPTTTAPAASPQGTILVTRGAFGGESPDALAAAAVAGRLDAPIFYSQGDVLAPITKQWLDRRGTAVPERAIIVGGPGAVPQTVVEQLEGYGIRVERIAGSSRIDTAIALASFDEAFGGARGRLLIAAADRWADTVAASAQGGAKGWPVLLVWKDSLPDSVRDYVARTDAGAVIIGGAGVVSDATQYELSKVVRRLP